MSKGKEVVSLGPTRRSHRAKNQKPCYRVDSASDKTNSQDKCAGASKTVGVEDYNISEFAEAEPIRVFEKMTKVQWDSIVDTFEAQEQEENGGAFRVLQDNDAQDFAAVSDISGSQRVSELETSSGPRQNSAPSSKGLLR